MKQKPAAANQATGRRIVVGADLEKIVPSSPRKTAGLCEGIYPQIAIILSYDANLRRRNLRVYFCGYRSHHLTRIRRRFVFKGVKFYVYHGG